MVRCRSGSADGTDASIVSNSHALDQIFPHRFLFQLIIAVCARCFAARGILAFASRSKQQQPYRALTIHLFTAPHTENTMHPVVEVTLSWLLSSAKGRDEKSFYRSPAFKDLQEPTIEISSTECGAGSLAEPAQLKREHSHDGEGRFPGLRWETPPAIAGKVREWLLVVEDPDAPLPTPIVHG